MALPSSADVIALIESHQYSKTRNAIYRSLNNMQKQAVDGNAAGTSCAVTSPLVPALKTEIENRGHTCSHDGSTWTLDWSAPAAASLDNSVFTSAQDMSSICSRSGAAFFCKTMCSKIDIAQAFGQSSVSLEYQYDNAIETILTSKGYTVAHDGDMWTVSW